MADSTACRLKSASISKIYLSLVPETSSVGVHYSDFLRGEGHRGGFILVRHDLWLRVRPRTYLTSILLTLLSRWTFASPVCTRYQPLVDAVLALILWSAASPSDAFAPAPAQ